MDQTSQQVIAVILFFATVVLVYTARYFQRRGQQRNLRALPGMERISGWTSQSIEAQRPLHLAHGSAEIGQQSTPAALAQSALFANIIKRAGGGDVAPIISTSAATTLPLAQDTLRRSWQSDGAWARAHWLPADLAYAAGISATLHEDDPAAHILAGGFGPELALMLDDANRRGQASLAISDQLQGQAIAYAMADEVLIGEEIYAAHAYATEDGRAQADAIVMDVWRALLIAGLAGLLLLEVAQRMPGWNWALILSLGAILLILVLILMRRR